MLDVTYYVTSNPRKRGVKRFYNSILSNASGLARGGLLGTFSYEATEIPSWIPASRIDFPSNFVASRLRVSLFCARSGQRVPPVLAEYQGLAKGVNTQNGRVINAAVAAALGYV